MKRITGVPARLPVQKKDWALRETGLSL